MATGAGDPKQDAALIRDLTLRLLFVDTEAAKLDEEVFRYRLRVYALIAVTLGAMGTGAYGVWLLSIDDLYGFALLYPAGLVGMLTAIGWVLLTKELKKWITRRAEFRSLSRRYSRNP